MIRAIVVLIRDHNRNQLMTRNTSWELCPCEDAADNTVDNGVGIADVTRPVSETFLRRGE